MIIDFFEKQKAKTTNNSKKSRKSGTLGLRAGGGFLAVGTPPLPDPECLQPEALDPPCGSTLVVFDFVLFFPVVL